VTTNGLLRQYFPRSSTNFRTYTQADLDALPANSTHAPAKP
jgi:IS30 family transposase